jgi:hypothetical protein
MVRPALTLFSWGYWGWGESTPDFVRAADAVEQSRGFAPPCFVDIRMRRSGRAADFVGDAFARVAGHGRYCWMQSLGNAAIVSKTAGPIRINKPEAAGELLELALRCAREGQRVIFFCACEYPRVTGKLACHRTVVASLVLNEARKRGIKVELVEWQGGISGSGIKIPVADSEAQKIQRGKKSLELGRAMPEPELLGLPWGSIVRVKSEHGTFLALAGAARLRKGEWFLPIVNSAETSNLARLKRQSERERESFGLTPLRT